MSHPTRGAWIEICLDSKFVVKLTSHPTWGAWIEIISLRELFVNF